MNANTHSESRLVTHAKVLFLLMGTFIAITIAFYVGIYLVNHVWQALFAAAVLGGALVMVPVSYRFFRRGYRRAVFAILIAGLMLGYGVNELVWEGLLPYHLIGGIILLYLFCNLLLPRIYAVWAIFFVVYLAFLAYVNFWPPLQRVDHTQIPALLLYAVLTNLLLVIVFGGITAYFALGKRIRTRLMVLFTLLVGIPLVLTGAILSFQMINIVNELTTTQLEFAIALRQAEVENWLDGLNTRLERARPSPRNSSMIKVLTDLGPEPDYSRYRSDLSFNLGGLVDDSASILRIYLLNAAGIQIFSTESLLIGANRSTEVVFQEAMKGITVSTPVYFDPEKKRAFFQLALPVLNSDNETIGVIVADIGFDELDKMMAAGIENSQTGETLMFAEGGTLLSPSQFGYEMGDVYLLSSDQVAAIEDRRSGQGTNEYTSYRGAQVLGTYRWVQPLGVLLVAEKALFEARVPMFQAILVTLGVTLLALVLALAAAWFASSRMARPINGLAQTATAVAAGNLNLMAAIEQEDEIGDLARVFNSMTAQLSGQLTQLEKRVAERTEELEKRSLQLQVAAEIARDASSTQDFELLIQQAVDLVRERFGFYHAGIFLLNEVGEYAVLRAATGEAGQRMMAREHKLKLGEEGMVGFVAARGVSRIALDVGEEPAYFHNPDLPLTRSEMALPLKVGARVIGVLDVQSESEKAFTQEDVVILQTMADQLAVAIENARLLNEVQTSLQQVESMYGAYSQQSWMRVVSAHELSGFQYDAARGVMPLSASDAGAQATDTQLALIPLRVRGQVVGTLRVYPGQEGWSNEQLALLDVLGDRISQAMESARLYEESQQRAANEQVISAITARMRATMDMDTILQTTIREIRHAFDLQEVEIRLGMANHEQATPADATASSAFSG